VTVSGRADSFLTLLGRFVVRVHGARLTGTGFFAAPGKIVTCAHVVDLGGAGVKDRRTADRVRVSWAGSEYEGEVTAHPPCHRGGGVWSYPDLAVVELDTVPPDEPWVPLSDTMPQTGALLYAAGYSSTFAGTPELGGTTVEFESPQRFNGRGVFKVKSGELAPGMSGGALLDPVSNGVCGVVKTTRREGWDMGGLAVPASAIQEFFPDLWAENRRLRFLQDRAGEWLALLSALRHESAHRAFLSSSESQDLITAAAQTGLTPRALYWKAIGELGPEPDSPLDDFEAVIRELADALPAHPAANHPLVRLVELVAGFIADGARTDDDGKLAAETDGLTEIARRLSGRSDPTSAQRDSRPWTENLLPVGRATARTPSVEVQLAPDGVDREKHLLTILKYDESESDATSVLRLDTPLPLGEVRQHVRKVLPDVIQKLSNGAEELMVAFTLPRNLLHKANVDEWDLGKEWAPLGKQFLVALRSLDRPPEANGSWQKRWKSLHARTQENDHSALNWVDCRSTGKIDQLFADFQMRESMTVLAISHQPDSNTGEDALEAALQAGIPAVIWPRVSCHEHGTAHCDDTDTCNPPSSDTRTSMANEPALCAGDRFQATISDRIAQSDLSELPLVVKRLRIEARTTDLGGDNHCGHSLTLLWDDPTRKLPEWPLLAAPAQRI
jgi:hypothetical protein